jgi:Ca-activated chloride channel family protein
MRCCDSFNFANSNLAMADWSTLEFKWPFMLWGLLLWPLWMAWRGWWSHRSARSVSLPAPAGRAWDRILEGLALAVLLLALARPHAVLVQPMRDAAVMLVIDTSASMKADDVAPNRLDAARNAARHFIETKPGLLQVGIVAVGGTAMLTQVPTLQREDLTRALDELSWQNGSALGTGVLIALDTLLPQAGIDPQKILDEAAQPKAANAITPPPPPQAKNPLDAPTDPRDRSPEPGLSKAIVLLTDGEGNMGPGLVPMAELAARHKVRVHVVGVGTPAGSIVKEQGLSMRTRLDEEPLRKVAQITLGEYRRAQGQAHMMQVYDDLGHRMKFEKRGIAEVTHWMALLGVALALLSASLTIARRGHMG